MKSITCFLLCFLATLAAADEISRFEALLSDIRQYETQGLDVRQKGKGVCPVLPDSFWKTVEDLDGFNEREIGDFCSIVQVSHSLDIVRQAGLALKAIGNQIGRFQTAETVDRSERLARCLYRASGERGEFERTAIYKKLLRARIELRRAGP